MVFVGMVQFRLKILHSQVLHYFNEPKATKKKKAGGGGGGGGGGFQLQMEWIVLNMTKYCTCQAVPHYVKICNKNYELPK